MSKVVVQLLSWNGEKHLRSVLDSLAKQTFGDFELLVLDNGSTDASIAIIEEMLKTFPHPARLIRSTENLGFAGGHNRLFALTECEYVFCVNQDAVPDDYYLERVIELLNMSPDAGAASGVLRSKNGKIDTAGLAKNWYQKIFDMTQEPSALAFRVFGVSGALPVYRRKAIFEVSPNGKLFDERYFAYKEDVDLAWRLNMFGWNALTVSAAHAVHERGFGGNKKWDNAYAFRQKMSSRNHLLTLVKDLPSRDFWRLPVILFYELGKLAYLAVFVPKSLGYIPGFFRLLPETLKMRKVVWQRLKSKQKHG